jgi:hypothetical protein
MHFATLPIPVISLCEFPVAQKPTCHHQGCPIAVLYNTTPGLNGDEFVRGPALFIAGSPVMMAMAIPGAFNFSPQFTSQMMMEKSDGGDRRTNSELISFTSK